MPASWFDHDGQRLQDDRLPKGKDERTALAEPIGADGQQLLVVLDADMVNPRPANEPAGSAREHHGRMVWSA